MRYDDTPLGGIGSHRFERSLQMTILVRTMASLSHVAQSFRSEKASSRQDCKGWHLCSKSHTSDMLSQAKAIIIGCVQKEAYQVEVLCLKKGGVIPKGNSLRKLDPVCDENGVLRIGGWLQ